MFCWKGEGRVCEIGNWWDAQVPTDKGNRGAMWDHALAPTNLPWGLVARVSRSMSRLSRLSARVSRSMSMCRMDNKRNESAQTS